MGMLENYYDGAQVLYKIARNNHIVEQGTFSDHVAATILTELSVVCAFVVRHPTDEPLDQVLRSRVEYLMLVIHSALRRNDGADKLGSDACKFLHQLLRLIVGRVDLYDDVGDTSSLEESNAVDTSAGVMGPGTAEQKKIDDRENDLPQSRTRWLDMCLTSVALALVSLITQVPQAASALEIGMTEAIALLPSPHWQVQLVAMSCLHAQIRYEVRCDVESAAVIGQSSDTLQQSSSPSSSSSSKQTGKPAVAVSPSSKSNKLMREDSSKVVGGGSRSTKMSNASSTRNSNSAGTGIAENLEGGAEESAGNASGRPARQSNPTIPTSSSNTSSRVKAPPNQLRKSASSLGGALPSGSFRASSSGRALRYVDELCKSGYLRSLVWLLIHRQEAVRATAAKMLEEVVRIATSSTVRGNAATATDLWACCVEQGVVAHLEYVRQGLRVHQRRDPHASTSGSSPGHAQSHVVCFPEVGIRALAAGLLERLASAVAADGGLLARLTGALMHSGNTKLRVNILSGLLYLSGRQPSIGRQLCSPVAPSGVEGSSGGSTKERSAPAGSRSSKGIATGLTNATEDSTAGTALAPRRTVLNDMLLTVVRDHGELRGLLRLMAHYLESASTLSRLPGNMGKEIATQTGHTHRASSTSGSGVVPGTMECMVLIKDNSRVTKMVCPSLDTIHKHSKLLHAKLEEAMARQIALAMRDLQLTGAGGGDELEQRLQSVLKGMDEAHFVTLTGSYNIWQEVFSHMTDTFLLESSVQRMTTLGVIEALSITAQFGMGALGLQYADELARRLGVESFVQVFQAAVGIYWPAKSAGAGEASDAPLRMHLRLVLQCLRFLDSNVERIITIWKPKDTAVIVDALHRVLLSMFLVEVGS